MLSFFCDCNYFAARRHQQEMHNLEVRVTTYSQHRKLSRENVSRVSCAVEWNHAGHSFEVGSFHMLDLVVSCKKSWFGKDAQRTHREGNVTFYSGGDPLIEK